MKVAYINKIIELIENYKEIDLIIKKDRIEIGIPSSSIFSSTPKWDLELDKYTSRKIIEILKESLLDIEKQIRELGGKI